MQKIPPELFPPVQVSAFDLDLLCKVRRVFSAEPKTIFVCPVVARIDRKSSSLEDRISDALYINGLHGTLTNYLGHSYPKIIAFNSLETHEQRREARIQWLDHMIAQAKAMPVPNQLPPKDKP